MEDYVTEKFQFPMTPSGIKPATCQFVA